MVEEKKLGFKKPRSTSRAVVDPVASTMNEVEARMVVNSGSVLNKSPLREWLVGLLEVKTRVGAQLPWDDIVTRLALGAQAAIEPGAKIVVDGKERRPTEEEIATLRDYATNPVDTTAVRRYVRRVHMALWIRVKATSNARGTGTRSDER